MHAAILAVIKPDLPQEVVQNSNLVEIILVCFICKHHNLIQNAFKLLKGTISVTHWIIFFYAKQCHWTSFQASYM